MNNLTFSDWLILGISILGFALTIAALFVALLSWEEHKFNSFLSSKRQAFCMYECSIPKSIMWKRRILRKRGKKTPLHSKTIVMGDETPQSDQNNSDLENAFGQQYINYYLLKYSEENANQRLAQFDLNTDYEIVRDTLLQYNKNASIQSANEKLGLILAMIDSYESNANPGSEKEKRHKRETLTSSIRQVITE